MPEFLIGDTENLTVKDSEWEVLFDQQRGIPLEASLV
jgi:hypothetical protein